MATPPASCRVGAEDPVWEPAQRPAGTGPYDAVGAHEGDPHAGAGQDPVQVRAWRRLDPHRVQARGEGGRPGVERSTVDDREPAAQPVVEPGPVVERLREC